MSLQTSLSADASMSLSPDKQHTKTDEGGGHNNENNHDNNQIEIDHQSLNDTQRLQSLINGNALIASFLGEIKNVEEIEQGEQGKEKDTVGIAQAKILQEINECTDVEALVDGIMQDLHFFPQIMQVGVGSVNTTNNNDDHSQEMTDPNPHDNETTEKKSTSASTTNTNYNDANFNATTTTTSTPTDPLVAPQVQVPSQLQTLSCRISRIKRLLYNELSNSDQTSMNDHNSMIHFFTARISSLSSTSKFPTVASEFLHCLFKENEQQNNNDNNTTISTSASVSPNHHTDADADADHDNKDGSNSRKLLFFPKLLQHLHKIPFEARKDVASIFNYLLVCGCIHNIGNNSSSNNNSSIRDSATNINNEDVILSYTTSMMEFVSYINEYFDMIVPHIIHGHFIEQNNNQEQLVNPASLLSSSSPPPPPLSSFSNQSTSVTDTAMSTVSNNTDATAAAPTLTKTPDVALHCGSMLRCIIRHPSLYQQLLVNNQQKAQSYIFPFLDTLVNQPNFEVASDALETLRQIMHPAFISVVIPYSATATTFSNNIIGNDINPTELESIMEKIATTFLETNYKPLFIIRFNPKLLSSDHANYITRRICLQLLSTILLTRSNYNIMIKYVSNWNNLRTIMMLLRDPSAHITLEAFNVFKIFVANPNKPMEIVKILANNKVKLVKYLSGLHKEREMSDEQFRDEKALVIATLEQLEC